jgi:hypothetical protein
VRIYGEKKEIRKLTNKLFITVSVLLTIFSILSCVENNSIVGSLRLIKQFDATITPIDIKSGEYFVNGYEKEVTVKNNKDQILRFSLDKSGHLLEHYSKCAFVLYEYKNKHLFRESRFDKNGDFIGGGEG